MKNILVAIFLLNSVFIFSQVNIEEIKQNVTENPKKFYYDKLEIFKLNPENLAQNELNNIYYGDCFVDYGYNRLDFNNRLNNVTKFAKNSISKKSADKLLEKALPLFDLNPINKELLLDLINIYDKLGNVEKSELHTKQYQLLLQTIEKSGSGKLDNEPIVVTNFSDKFTALEMFSTIFTRGIDFKTKVLEDGSWLDIFKNGTDLFFIRTVNHKDMFKDFK